MTSTLLKLPVALACVLLAAGCAPVGPGLKPPALPAHLVQAPGFIEGAAAAYVAAPLPSRWWRLYREPELDALMEEAFRANTDLRVAAANLEAARAIVQATRSAAGVQASASGGVTYGKATGLGEGAANPAQAAFDAGIGIAYEVDVVGRIKRTIEAVQMDARAQAAAYDLARINIAAAVATDYTQACAMGASIAVANQSIKLQRSSLALTQRGVQGGLYPPLVAVRSRVLLDQLEAAVVPLESSRRSALYSLAVLLGRPPRDYPPALAACTAIPKVAQTIPVGNGMDLVRRRPDIREAESRLMAATARIGVATADLYPSVSLGATLGSTSRSLGNLASGSAYRFSVGPLISWNFPNTGVARARIAESDALARAALAGFDGSVLTALRETETALGTYARDLDGNAKLKAARDDSRTAAAAQAQMSGGGLGTSLDLLDAQRTLANAEAALVQSDAAIATDSVKLFLALGGGWETTANAAP